MTTQEKYDRLKEFQNEADFRLFLIDFLKKRGFKDVFHTHRYGNPELGKDIIARFPHGIDEFEWYAFVVKKGRIGGGTNEIETIKGQIKQSFEYPYLGINGERIKINKVKVVTNENFTNGAQDSLSTSNELKGLSNYGFWWNETLVPDIDTYYDDFWLPGDAFAKEYSKAFIKKLQQEIEIRELSIQKINDKQIQKLLDIFIEPQLSMSSIEEDKITKEKSVKKKKVSISGINRIEENLILSGEQGAGKTKILNNLACQICKPENVSAHNIIPIKLKAPNVKLKEFNIEKCVKDEITELAEDFVDEKVFEKYKVVLFVDDLDLLKNEDKEILVQNIKEYCSKNLTHFVLTYRKSEFNFDSEINSIRIHNFNNKQVEAFVTKFFEGTDRGTKFIQILKESGILSKLPTTPLTITLISLLYDENNYEIPATLSDIYTDFTNILLGKLEITSKTDLLVLNIKRRLFSTLALKMLDKKVFEITYDDFRIHINDFLEERGYASQSDEEINMLIENSGLMYNNDNLMIGFKQQAFIEFLASLEIYHNKRETHYSKLIENFNDINWQNTAIFYAGHAKELVNMIDDVIEKAPNNNLRDYFVNAGGMGYLSQALYQTSPKERSKLVKKSLDNLMKSFYILKENSKKNDDFFFNIPLVLLASIVNFWFNENFKSITLTRTLNLSFDDIFNYSENNFENNYKLLMISTTLMNPYINDENSFAKLIERKEFMNNGLLPMVADVMMKTTSINQHNISPKVKSEIAKTIRKKRELIKLIVKEPAHRFNDNLDIDKPDSADL